MTNGQLIMRLQAVKKLAQEPDRLDHAIAAIETIVEQTLEEVKRDEAQPQSTLLRYRNSTR